MSEWQTESSLFTIRIRGKQWYWIYKFDLKAIVDILSVPKNIGNNKWMISTFGDVQIADDYLHILQLRANSQELINFWNKIVNSTFKKTENSINDFIESSEETTQFNEEISSSKIDCDEINRWTHKSNGTISPLRIIKTPLKYTNFNTIQTDFDQLLVLRFNDNTPEITPKLISQNNFLTMKQKRYNRKKFIISNFELPVSQAMLYNNNANKLPYLFNNQMIYDAQNYNQFGYEFFKKNKILSENISLVLARRLLRTKRTLILPAQLNLGLITNSYDVVHSWFVPGLGLKFDCVPGRATHHVLHVDTAGFYYGQCAEICGRYHHHMPIRMCALPYDHFVIWWNTFGLPKLLDTAVNHNSNYGFRKYSW